MYHAIETKGGRHKVAIMWESVSEVSAYADKLKRDRNKSEAVSHAIGKAADRGQEWLGAPTLSELRRRLTQGWPEGVERLQKLAIRELNPTSLRRRRYKADQGDELDIQAVYAGNLSRAWSKTRRQSRAGTNRTVTLVCNLADSAGTDSADLFWRGAATLRVADALTEAGYNVGIYGAITSASCSKDSTVDSSQFIEIKSPDTPLDTSALAAITAMPGWFRSAGFAGIATTCDLVDKDVCESYGSPAHHRIGEFAEFIGLTNCHIQGQINSKKAAEQWIDSVMEQIEPSQEAA